MDRLRLVRLLAVAAACAVARIATAAQAEPIRIAGQHYELRAQMDAESGAELLRVLEVAWPVLEERFHCAPRLDDGELLRVRVHADREAWAEALQAEGADVPPELDLLAYRPASATVHLVRQASGYHTRALAILGACLQFFQQAEPKNRDLADCWFVQGMASHLAQHRWDGRRLELGARLEFDGADLARSAWERWRSQSWEMERLGEDDLAAPEISWSLVRFLLAGGEGRYRKRFEKLALGSSGSRLSGEEYARALGQPASLAREVTTWLEGEIPDWQVLAGDWEEPEPGRARAAPAAGLFALAVAPPDAVGVRVELALARGACAGVVLDLTGSGVATIGLVQDGRVHLLRTDGERRDELLELADAGSDRPALALHDDSGVRRLVVDGIEVFRLVGAYGRMGLCVTQGTAELRSPQVILPDR